MSGCDAIISLFRLTFNVDCFGFHGNKFATVSLEHFEGTREHECLLHYTNISMGSTEA